MLRREDLPLDDRDVELALRPELTFELGAKRVITDAGPHHRALRPLRPGERFAYLANDPLALLHCRQ